MTNRNGGHRPKSDGRPMGSPPNQDTGGRWIVTNRPISPRERAADVARQAVTVPHPDEVLAWLLSEVASLPLRTVRETSRQRTGVADGAGQTAKRSDLAEAPSVAAGGSPAPYIQNTDVHVVPVGDLREHVCARTCWCRPTEDDEDSTVIIHHAMDERETYEQGRKPQ